MVLMEVRGSQLPTPQRVQSSTNRRSKSTPEVSNNNPRKVAKANLNHAFSAVSDEDSVVLEPLKDISEKSIGDKHASEPYAVISNLSLPSSSSTSTIIPSSTVTSEKHATVDSSDFQGSVLEVDLLNIELEVVIEHLREARHRVMKSKDCSHSKKLLVALIDTITQEFSNGLHEKKACPLVWLNRVLAPNNADMVFLTCIVVIFTLLVLWTYKGVDQVIHTGPPPT